jgi:O-antigen/teichoic acid export membrane protein
MNVNVALNLISLGIRVGGGVVALVLVAKMLPIHEFGNASIAMAAAALIMLPANFGLNVLILKEGGQQGAALPAFLRAVLGYRLVIGLSLIGLAAAASAVMWQYWLALVLLCLCVLMEALMDVFICGLRATGDYRSEITWGTWVVVCNLIAVAAVCHLMPTATGYALAMVLARVLVLACFVFTVRFAAGVATAQPALGFLAIAKRSWSNFIELGSQTFLVQVDSLILAAAAGPQQLAVYQAVMKLVHGASQLTSVMLNIALPKAGSLSGQPDQKSYLAKVLMASAVTGVVVGACMAASGHLIGHWMYQGKFGDLGLLCVIAGAFLCIRYVGAGFGIAMITRGQTTDRLAGISLAIVTVVITGMPLSERFGAVGMMTAMALGYAALTAFATLRGMVAAK